MIKKISFDAVINKFSTKGEKTGWSYISIPIDVAILLKPGNKKTFRVKGLIDMFPISKVAVMPMGDGTFILPVNAAIRKGTGKKAGSMVSVSLVVDKSEIKIDTDFLECLEEEPRAKKNFLNLSLSHRNYYSKWIESAKTENTKSTRIARAIAALDRGMHYGEMLKN